MQYFSLYLQMCVYALCLGFSNTTQGQSDFSPIAPLRIPIEFSGNFAELRNNHFHGGVDYRTQQREGLEVLAIEDGSIYRIGISPTSYGKVLYLKHGNSISVYAHLSGFSSYIDSCVTAYQYKEKKNEIDYLLETPINVSQGDVIAFSGNTGSSGGPHLHFEIRDSADMYQVNPCFFGLCPSDSIAPTLIQFALYPLSSDARIQNKKKVQYFKIKAENTQIPKNEWHSFLPQNYSEDIEHLYLWALKDTHHIKLWGKIGFGIETIDRMENSPFKFGLYRLAFWVDTQCVYQYTLDSIPITKTNALNAHIDYPYFINANRRIEHSKKLNFNELDIYTILKDQGSFLFSKEDTAEYHRISVFCEDFRKNVSLLQIDVGVNNKHTQHIDAETSKKEQHSPSYAYTFHQDKHQILPQNEFLYETATFSLAIPKNSLFDTAYFEKKKKRKSSAYISAYYHIPLEDIPLKQGIDIGIAYPQNFPKNLLNKLLIIHIDKNKRVNPLFSTLKEEKIHGISQKFGTFVISIDTIAPKIESSNLDNPTNKAVSFTAKVSDNLSGIHKYEAFLNGEWLRLYYDKKTKTLTSDSLTHLPKGKYELNVYLEDAKENGNEYTYTIIL